MSDILGRIEELAPHSPVAGLLLIEAADEITRLRAQLTGRIEDIRVQEETILAVRKERDALRAQVAAQASVLRSSKHWSSPTMSNTPLPEPIAWTSSRNGGKTWITTNGDPTDLMPDEGGIVHSLHTDNQLRVYAAAVSAAKDARIKVLEDALVEVLEFQSAPTQPTIHDWGCWRRVLHARAALGDKPTTPPLSPSPRS